jgi:hypothetical protein
MQEAWAFEHSIECGVSKDFAWTFWTNPSNWALDTDVDSVELYGPFAPGSQGVTQSKSSGRIEWRIADVQPGRAVLEFPAPGALATFIWTFDDLNGRTRITQRASLSGKQAPMYTKIVAALEAGIPAGMHKLCEAMEAAARKSA